MAPEALEGMHILDLGSGSGQDCFVLSKLVGENGHVTGVDMTKEQVCLALVCHFALLQIFYTLLGQTYMKFVSQKLDYSA